MVDVRNLKMHKFTYLSLVLLGLRRFSPHRPNDGSTIAGKDRRAKRRRERVRTD